MRELNFKEKDLLDRIEKSVDLQPFFFRKAKGLRWFNYLKNKGFFSGEKNPKPIPSKEGSVRVLSWPAAQYLTATSIELSQPENKKYAIDFLEIIRNATRHAQDNGYSNYRTWHEFSKILNNLPIHLIQKDDLSLIDYWLNDVYNCGLVIQELCKNFLVKLVKKDVRNATLALRLIDIVFSIRFEEKIDPYNQKIALLRFNTTYAREIVANLIKTIDEQIILDVAKIFESKIVSILDNFNNDSHFYAWRKAIEEHNQNHAINRAEDILIAAYRDSLLYAVKYDLPSSEKYLQELLSSEYQTLRRLAIYVVNKEFDQLKKLTKSIIAKENFIDGLRHELWHFLKLHYNKFHHTQQRKVLKIIKSLTEISDGKVEDNQTAYQRSIWLSAISGFDQEAKTLYQEYIKVTNVEPEHPDFVIYMSTGNMALAQEAYIPINDLLTLSVTGLIEKIKQLSYGNDLESLSKVFKEVIKSKANDVFPELEKFLNLNPTFINSVVEAYLDLWSDKSTIQWKSIWPRLLDYCAAVIKNEEFWLKDDSEKQNIFVVSKHKIVTSIARLIEEGTRYDEHSFDPSLLLQSKEILLLLLARQEGKTFSSKSDAVSIAINSPRGYCIKALINHSLRSCRLYSKSAWQDYEAIYNDEIKRNKLGEYEFSTLVTYYLRNFLYMSEEWVENNLSTIFDQSDHQKWLCAMQGYANANIFHLELYKYLKDNNDFIRVLDLDNDHLNEYVQETIIQHIIVSYINDYDSLDDLNSLISILLKRTRLEELCYLIWFVWTLHDEFKVKLLGKIYELWPRLLKIIDLDEEKAPKLASLLCYWSLFIDEITDVNQDWLSKIASYTDEDHNSFYLLENLARISKNQPLEAQKIWLTTLLSHSSDYPEESTREILNNLINLGSRGERKAKEIVDSYIRYGIESPSLWFKEIKEKAINP